MERDEFRAIKDKMAKLAQERHELLSLTDIVGGDKGFRENMRLIALAEEKQREIGKLSRRLFREN